MAQSPIITTLDTLMADLKETTNIVREKEKHATGLTAAIKSLIGVCEDEEVKTNYLLALEEITGRSGFMDAARAVLRERTSAALTPSEIRGFIVSEKIMDLSGYSNALASIHTTLHRLEKKKEVQETTNRFGEKAYRWIPRAPAPPGEAKRKAMALLERLERNSK